METYMKNAEDELMVQIQTACGDPIGVGHGTINGGNISSDSAEELKTPISEHLVRVSADAPSSCIDGRPCSSCMDGSETEPRPSVAGGGLITAYAAAELTGWFEDEDTNPAVRLNNLSTFLAALQIKFGGHCDESAVAAEFKSIDAEGKVIPKTGCGANDRLPEILTQPFQNQAEVTALTEAVMNHGFSKSNYNPAFMNFTDPETIGREVADWNPVDLIDKLGGESAANIEILKGTHAEFAVVFNYVEGTTIDRDAFAEDTGEQAFVVDVWYLEKLAAAMARGPEIEKQQKHLLHAMVAYQVSTYLTLCDGSQRPYFVG